MYNEKVFTEDLSGIHLNPTRASFSNGLLRPVDDSINTLAHELSNNLGAQHNEDAKMNIVN